MGKCDGEYGVNGPVDEFFSNARAKGNLIGEKRRKFRIKFIRNSASVVRAELGSYGSIRES